MPLPYPTATLKLQNFIILIQVWKRIYFKNNGGMGSNGVRSFKLGSVLVE